jgi:AGCS family alanine or glycine:cation symporter
MKKKFLSLLLLAIPIFSFAQEVSMDEKIEAKFKPFADAVSSAVFYPISIVGIDVPIVIIVLLLGALFFTLYFKFANIT